MNRLEKTLFRLGAAVVGYWVVIGIFAMIRTGILQPGIDVYHTVGFLFS